MKLFKGIPCVYSCRDEKIEYECSALSRNNSMSFAIEAVEEQLLLNEEILKKALSKEENLETDGVYMYMSNWSIIPVKSKVHITILPEVTNFYATNLNISIGIKNADLNKILDIK